MTNSEICLYTPLVDFAQLYFQCSILDEDKLVSLPPPQVLHDAAQVLHDATQVLHDATQVLHNAT